MIEIPGYRVLRPLGRGGMATVYLALQESVQREVALKVMSPALLGDPQFGERFLREARIAARLRHRHVVQVHDVGVHGDHHYIAMEYLPGGPVLHKGSGVRPPGFALRAVRQIAEALDYAHANGVVHRDIKPDNILLREDGSAALTDFGIARANDITRMTRTGAIVGTPHYMSPEQARGQPLDGRADLYSLGIVFHELLVGKPPFEADDSLAVGIMHITAPLPVLPAELQALQALLDGMLAKDPEARFQSGAELAAALAPLEREYAGEDALAMTVHGFTPRAQSSPPPRVRMPTPVDGAFNEPRIGNLDGVESTPSPRRRRARRRRSGIGWAVALVVLLLAGGALWQFQDRLRASLPGTHLNALLDDAAAALAQQRYSATDGSGARELYAAVLAVDPDNQVAHQGLRAVGAGLLASTRAALARGDLASARVDLTQARELSVASGELDALDAEIRNREQGDVAIGTLLRDAGLALAAGRLDGDDGAVSLYQRAHVLVPSNAAARVGREQALSKLLEQASAALASDDAASAAAAIERVAAIDPAHLGLPAARAALAERLRTDEAALAGRLERAEQLLAEGRLTVPEGNNARELFDAVLAQDPDNARARAGLARIAAVLVGSAERATADFEFDRAEALLAVAGSVAPGSSALTVARKRLQDARERHQRRFAARSDAPDPARDAKVTALLEQARSAADAGQVTAPPGDSAYDKYRAVRALDPRNPAAIAGIAALPALARSHFDSALSAIRLGDAYGYLEALQSLSPGDPQLPGMRSRLAGSYIGYASERLGAGELDRAAHALDRARELAPNHEDLPSLRARLEQAGGG